MMTPEQFVYWLQGFMEMAEPVTLTEKQTQQIKDHLALVFNKKTPERFEPYVPPTYDLYPPTTVVTPYPPPPQVFYHEESKGGTVLC